MGKFSYAKIVPTNCLLILILAVLLGFTIVFIEDVYAAENDITLEYTLSDGIVVRLDAASSDFSDYAADELSLEVKEKTAEADTKDVLSSVLAINDDSMNARIFDICVMGLDAKEKSDSTINLPNVPMVDQSIIADEKVTEKVKIQPQGTVTVTFILPQPIKANDEVKVYHIDEKNSAPEDMNAKIGDAGEVILETNHFSQFVVVVNSSSPSSSPSYSSSSSPSPRSTPNLTAVTVSVDWIGGNAHMRPTSTTVDLCVGNTPVPNSTVILNAGNQWTHTWKDLPVKKSSGKIVDYIVRQFPPPDTKTELKYFNDITSAWIPTEIPEVGETYLLADQTKPPIYAMAYEIGNPQKIKASRPSYKNFSINGVSTSAIYSPDSTVSWTVVKDDYSSPKFYLKNSETAYLCQNKDTAGNPSNLGVSGQKQTLFTYTSAKALASDANTWVQRYSNTYTYTQTEAAATPITLYHEVSVDKKVKFVNYFEPTNPSAGAKVDYHKRIDFLGDKEINPDTLQKGKDDYRLYLDVASGIKMPADLILVLDVSGSMDLSRMDFLNNALLGDDAFIAKFLKAHPSNHLSIVCFWGAQLPNWKGAYNWAGDNPITNGRINAGQDVGDATIFQHWITAANLPYAPTFLKKGVGGTNYGAGLYQAQRLLTTPPMNPSPTKYMVFMSDGVPTHGLSTKAPGGIINTQNVIEVFGQLQENVPLNLKSATGIYRYGSGEGATFNVGFCKDANKILGVNFALSNPDLNIFSVGVGNDDPEVLKYMASGTGRYLNAQKFEDLDSTFASILGPSNVVITDTLSEYVDFHDTTDLKLTSKCGTTTKTLWQNNEITTDGKNIIQSVKVDKNTKKIIATFVPKFTLSPNTVYTLSFNVGVTPKAYQDYAVEQKYPEIGEVDTDYVANKTSSLQPGFYANKNEDTTVSYSFDANQPLIIKNYQKPVVQVSAAEISLNILKTDDSVKKTPLEGAEFQIFNALLEPNNVWVKNGASMGTAVSGKDGKAVFAGKLYPGHYILVETKHPSGYQGSKEEIVIKIDSKEATVLKGQATITNTASDTWQVAVSNTPYLVLPATGGEGGRNLFLVGSGLVIFSAIMWISYLRKIRKPKNDSPRRC
ncbi:MAG: SpaA isopeptide-forming pilin-related protein [Clostridiales bacterium]